MTITEERKAPEGRKAPPLLIAAGVLIAAVIYLLSRGSAAPPRQQPTTEKVADTRAETGTVALDAETLKLAGLRVETVGYQPMQSRLVVTGTVEPDPSGVVKVTPRVAGKITAVRVNVGDTVRAGQVLATLASTELAEAQAEYDHTGHQLAIATTRLQRQKKLASLGAFGRPKVEEARVQSIRAQGDIHTARSEVAAASARVAEAQSQLQALQAALTQAQTQVKVAESRFNRADLMLKEQLVSRQDWEQARADQQRAEADVEAARAKVAQGEARIDTEKALLQASQAKLDEAGKRGAISAQLLAREERVFRGGYLTSKEIVEAEAARVEGMHDQEAVVTKIRLLGGTPGGGNLLAVAAPIGGRVTERLVTLGETVTPEKPLFTVMNLRTVWVQLNVYQKDLPAVRAGQTVAVTSDIAPGRLFTGRVSYIGDQLDETTRTVKVRCAIRNVGDRLKPETFVRGTIAGTTRRHVLVVPGDAVQEVDGKPVVFRPAGKPGEFRAIPIQPGEKLEGMVAIRSGLRAGDRVVTKNAFLVKSQAMKGELAEE
jgi:membrane fusion protein, heavy metal efflux system